MPSNNSVVSTFCNSSPFKKLLFLFSFWILLTFTLSAAPVFAQEAQNSVENEIPLAIAKDQASLLQITQRIVAIRKDLEDLKKNEPTKEIADRIEELQKELTNLNYSFETLATQLQAEELTQQEEVKIDWLKEIQEITKPLLLAIREITDKPRKIDTLKARIEYLKNQIKRQEEAKIHLETLASNNSIEDKKIKQVYQERLNKLIQKYNPELIQLKLDESQRALDQIQATEVSFFDFIAESFGEFFKVRGRNLLVAFSTFFGLWWGLNKILSIINSKTRLLKRFNPQLRKVMTAASNVLILGIAIFAGLISLYLQDDWLLLSIIILTLFAVAWSSRQMIPEVLKEIRLILDLSTVREGERLVWKGVPFLVKDIGLYATLVNTRLSGGVIKLPVGELIGQHSRPAVKDEPWFPTKTNDWVKLSDDTFGQVVTQTVEQVVLKHRGSMKYYPTSEFLNLHPINLSTGYTIMMEFGLDYGIQSRICDEIPKLFKEGLRKHLAVHFEKDPPDFQEVHVHFDNAGASSLNLLIVMKVDGRCAEDYFPFKWAISNTLVRICNENDLVIPFSQLTVSLADDVKSMTTTSLENQSLKKFVGEPTEF